MAQALLPVLVVAPQRARSKGCPLWVPGPKVGAVREPPLQGFPTKRAAVRAAPQTGVRLRRYHQPERDGRGFFLHAESKKVCKPRRISAGLVRYAGNSGVGRRIRERMSGGNITSLSGGPGAGRKRWGGACRLLGEDILTEVSARTAEKPLAGATHPYGPMGVPE